MCPKGVTKHFKQPSLVLAAGSAEDINRRADHDIGETAFPEHMPPACARQATGYSIGPQIDIAACSCRNLFTVRNVRKLQMPPGFSTRLTSAKTRRLSAQSLMTPLQITDTRTIMPINDS